MPNIAQIKVLTEQAEEQKKINLNIFKSLALANISVDFINVHPQQVLFTVKDSEVEKTLQILGTLGFKTRNIRRLCECFYSGSQYSWSTRSNVKYC